MALAVIQCVPASASTITFMQDTQALLNNEWTITNNGSNTITISAAGLTNMTFGNTGTFLDGLSPLQANFTLSAVSSTAGSCNNTCANNDPFNESNFSGSFHFLATSLDNFLYSIPVGTNLLSGTFNVTLGQHGATFSSAAGNGSATLQDSTDPLNTTQLVFSSAYLDFSGQTGENASFSLSSVSPNFALTSPLPAGCGASPLAQCTAFPAGSFTAAGTGTFASAPGFAPEPGTMTLFTAGAGLLALLGRRARSKSRN